MLAVVPARGGSKRVVDKNIRHLGGKPLIVWTIEAALDVPDLVDVLVSTDSPAIAQIAKTAGALVPWLRPFELATDSATSIAVCLHALDFYERENGVVDGLLLLQPTSPFRTTRNIVRAIQLFRENPRRPVLSLSPADSHPMWCYRVTNGSIEPFISVANMPTRSQDLPTAYVLNGAIYIASPDYLRRNTSFIGPDTVPLVMDDALESLDIDTEWDWTLAEAALNQLQIIQGDLP